MRIRSLRLPALTALLPAPLAALHAAEPAKRCGKRFILPTGDAAHPGTKRGTPFGDPLWEVGVYH
jgi:hypothetical protein